MVSFLSSQTTIGGETGTISSFATAQSTMYQEVQSTTDLGSTQLAAVADLTNNGSSFTVETSLSVIPSPTSHPLTPTPYQTKTIVIVAIVVTILGAGLFLLIYLIKRK